MIRSIAKSGLLLILLQGSLSTAFPIYDIYHSQSRELIDMTNKQREKRGLSPLKENSKLTNAARQHTLEMLQKNYFSHTSPVSKYRTLSERVKQTGLDPYVVSENLYLRESDSIERLSELCYESWRDSPGHRANMFDPEVTHIGVYTAGYNGKYLVTAVYAKP